MTAAPADRRAARKIEVSAFYFAIRPLAIDLASTLCFYLLLAITGSLVAAIASGVALGVAQLGWMRWRRRPIAPMQWALLVVVGLVSGAALALHDARLPFFQVSLAYLIVGAAMLKPGWIARYVPPIALANVPERLVVASGFVWAALILATAALNLGLVLALPARRAAAVMALWAPLSKLALFAGQYLVFRAIVRRRLVTDRPAGRDGETCATSLSAGDA